MRATRTFLIALPLIAVWLAWALALALEMVLDACVGWLLKQMPRD